MMTIQQTNLALQVTAGTLAAAALICLLVGLVAPLDLPEPQSSGVTPTVKSRIPRLPAIDGYTPIFARSLQSANGATSAAGTPGPADVQPAGSPMATAQLTLVGTIGDSIALIRGPDGTVGMVEIGDDVNGAPVVAIRPLECDLRVNGKLTTLKLAPSATGDGIIVPEK